MDCKAGPDSDKEGFAALIEELSMAFKPKGLLLSSAVSPSKIVIDVGKIIYTYYLSTVYGLNINLIWSCKSLKWKSLIQDIAILLW